MTRSPLRVLHCPVNVAGIPWQYVQALREKNVDARLLVFERNRFHPEADRSLDRPDGFLARQVVQWRALAQVLPKTDIFHFYFGLTLVPKSVQFLILHATGKRSVYHFLGSDIRGKSPDELGFAFRANARIVGNYDDHRWLPSAEVVLPGVRLEDYRPAPPSDRTRPLVVHAPSKRATKGTEDVIRACAGLDVDLEVVEGLEHIEAYKRYQEADIIIDQLRVGWYGVFAIEAMAMGKPVVSFLHDDALRLTQDAYGVDVPIVSATSETLIQRLRPLVESASERRRIGRASRAYVEKLHDVDLIADQLLDLYTRVMRA